MPLVKNTTTGNNYLVKINTDGDVCSRTAIRSYDKQLGSEGTGGNLTYTLPFTYEPGSHTLWVFVNGLKAVVEPFPSTALTYRESSGVTVLFGASLNDTDVIEFIVAGSYLSEEGGDIGDQYILVSGERDFTGNQSMGGNKLTGLALATDPADAVRLDQLESYFPVEAVNVSVEDVNNHYTGDNVESVLNEIGIIVNNLGGNTSRIPGRVHMMFADVIPANMLDCDGAEYLKDDLPELYAVIGDLYNDPAPSTSNHFRVPDARDQFLRSSGSTRNTGSLQGYATARPNTNLTTNSDTHNHLSLDRYTATYSTLGVTGGNSFVAIVNIGDTSVWRNTDDDSHQHQITGGGDAETRPDNLAVKICIEY